LTIDIHSVNLLRGFCIILGPFFPDIFNYFSEIERENGAALVYRPVPPHSLND
jgi:hypothetical protein